MSQPRRIVSLISSATEILYLLGLGDRVVGVSHECDYPPEISIKPRLTRSIVSAELASRQIDDQVRTLTTEQSALYEIDAVRLAELAPELVITQAQCDVCAVRYADVVTAVASSPALAATQVLALNPQRLMDVFDDIRRIGHSAGVGDRAAAAVAELDARVMAIRAITDSLTMSDRPRVACLEWIDPPMLAANWTPELVHWAGGHDGLQTGVHSTYADWDAIARFDPEVIVIMPCGFGLERAIHEAQVLTALPQWSSLAAVRLGRVFAVDGNAYFNRSGPRLVDSLEILAHLLHPRRIRAPALAEQPWRQLRTVAGRLVGRTS